MAATIVTNLTICLVKRLTPKFLGTHKRDSVSYTRMIIICAFTMPISISFISFSFSAVPFCIIHLVDKGIIFFNSSLAFLWLLTRSRTNVFLLVVLFKAPNEYGTVVIHFQRHPSAVVLLSFARRKG